MQREDKQLEMTLGTLVNRLNDLKVAISTMVHTLETQHETINWPTFMDNFALLSSHMTGISKALPKDAYPPLRNFTVLPLLLTPQRDESLVNLTEGRVPIFSHDIVPDYLRTKPDPIAEQKMIQNEQKASTLSSEAAMKQVAQYSKVVSHIHDMVCKAREEWEIDASSRTGIQQTSSMADTHALVAAVGMGKGLKMNMSMNVGGGGGPGSMMVPPAIRPQTSMSSVSPGNVNPMGKAPAGIKTNIKSAMQVHSFPR